ncbi:hypothetical protein H114_32614 [Streptomyces gancidicus BKS 13-15]|uniref:Uncharacterized protein n=1 Tax=Streptomyces gancidicus BKS 13-15 TaxID=1284664 RepID=M3B9H0_STREZ|nr:hypothetical protein [Streptomyces gancidicus]EMF20384.1 hypothetical protein H114_32614 [Streptomyces gancidicus BKS 13-15]
MPAAPTLTADQVTVTADQMGRPVAVVPDDVARLLAAASREGIDPEARGIDFESVAHPADSWVAVTVRTVFEAVLAARPDDADDLSSGLGQYRTYGGGTFYGFIVGTSGWDPDTRWWSDYDNTRDVHVGGFPTIAHRDRRRLAGTCTFS